MPHLAVAAVLHVSLMATGAQTYDDAYKSMTETGQPLVVMIGADWCPGCRTMKQAVLPNVQQRGGLKKVAFAYVNSDKQGALAGKLMSGSSIPQLVMYVKTADGWQRQQLTGAQSVSAVESFINRSLDKPTATLSSRN